jgi:hypothetical protein
VVVELVAGVGPGQARGEPDEGEDDQPAEAWHRETSETNSLSVSGIPLAPGRPSSWRIFLRAHWGEIASADFFTTDVWTPRGLVTYYTLFVIDLRSRRAHVAGSTPNPDAAFMAQAARCLTDVAMGSWPAIGSSSATGTASGRRDSETSWKARVFASS